MTILGSSDIIASTEVAQLEDGGRHQLLHFRDGKVLLLANQGMALYQAAHCIDDELGNGLLAKTSFVDGFTLPFNPEGCVLEYSAGFVGLQDDYALLITPVAIQLFNNRTDALYNRNEIARLELLPLL